MATERLTDHHRRVLCEHQWELNTVIKNSTCRDGSNDIMVCAKCGDTLYRCEAEFMERGKGNG